LGLALAYYCDYVWLSVSCIPSLVAKPKILDCLRHVAAFARSCVARSSSALGLGISCGRDTIVGRRIYCPLHSDRPTREYPVKSVASRREIERMTKAWNRIVVLMYARKFRDAASQLMAYFSTPVSVLQVFNCSAVRASKMGLNFLHPRLHP
jgi:hypothetical protein